MRFLSPVRIAALLLAAALTPQPGAAADAIHPLDPAAPAGVVPTQNTFENLVPLLDRDSPVPSFVGEAESSSSAEGGSLPPEDIPMDPGGMEHGAVGHAVPLAEAPQ